MSLTAAVKQEKKFEMSNRLSSHPIEWSYIAFLALIAAAPPISTDMYLAAIPRIAQSWHIGENIVSLSLVLWFVSFSISLLIFGPISDKYGRKPVLTYGLILFILSSFLCSTSINVVQLIAYRILQGVGAAAPSSMCMAICRDRFDAERRKFALAYVGIILTVAPMIAPMIGATILQFGNWHLIFIAQGTIVSTAFLSSLQYKETLKNPIAGNVFRVYGRYFALLKNRNFMLANLSMGLLPAPIFGYVAFSAIAYIKLFQLSEHAFSVLFGINAFTSMAGAFTCTRLTRKIPDEWLIAICILGCTAGGAVLIVFGGIHYLAFAAGMAIFTFFCGMSRPLNTNLILEQVDRDIGSASSMVVFYQFILGAVCMAIVTIKNDHPIRNFGFLVFSLPFIVLLIWPFLSRRLRKNKKENLALPSLSEE
jgi:MFS transporter, DHA1 family, multidrug resistance protein